MIGRIGERAGWLSLVAALATNALDRPTDPGIQYVRDGGASLLTLPDAEVAPRLAALEHGSAVWVEEEHEGFVRVSLRGWVAKDRLDPTPPAGAEAVPAKGSEPPPDAPTPESTRPRSTVRGLDRIASFDLAANLDRAVGATDDTQDVGLHLTLVLLDSAGARVLPADDEHGAVGEFEISVFEERQIAGGSVRGAKVLERTEAIATDRFTADHDAKIDLVLDELPRSVEGLKLILRLRTTEGRLFLGSLRGVKIPRPGEGG